MKNIPAVKLGIVAVSRDCFPEELAVNRRRALVEAYERKYSPDEIYECPVCIVESELHMKKALRDLEKAECNALCVYLGNFGPEIAETMLAEKFDGPVMFCAAAEEDETHLMDTRGDAYCGMLNAAYALHLRKVQAYIPRYPVGDADQCADMIHEFLPIARTLIGVRNLKIISFGPRPNNFLACNTPIQPLYDLGVEVEENSELDLFDAFEKHEGDRRIEGIAAEMAEELGVGNTMPEILPKLAQYEITLNDWIRTHKGDRKYVALTSKCWPAFETRFGFVPCFVNSRLTGNGIPVSCEVDIYGALSEYIGTCISGESVTILDINNTVPQDMYESEISGHTFNGRQYSLTDTFMGFHCGNTCSGRLNSCTMKNQFIMSRTLPEEVTKGTIEGDISAGKITLFRLQGTSDAHLKAYEAEGQILPVSTKSFGSTAIFGIPEMGRFYRYGLIGNAFPHHGAVAFGHYAKQLREVFRLLGLERKNIEYNHPVALPYADENPHDLLKNWF